MSYVQPTAIVFKARFPEFTVVADVLVNLVLDEAIVQVGETWLERDRARAQMLLAAHTLTMEGEPQRSTSGNGAAGSGLMVSRSVGDVSVTFANTSSASATGNGGSHYGKEFDRLMRKNFPPVAAV